MIEPQLGFFSFPGGWELLVVAGFGLLIFGGRLPNVARSVGKSIVEFKKGMREVKDELNLSDNSDRILPDNSRPAEPKAVESQPADVTPVESKPVDSEGAGLSGGQ